MLGLLKLLVKKYCFKKNNFYTVLKGPLKGFKLFVSNNSQYAPLVGNWEPVSQYIFSKLIKDGQTVFDLGANIGIHTMLFSKLVGNIGRVVAFEPLNDNYIELEKNIQINQLKNVILEKFALTDKKGVAVFHLGKHNTQGSLHTLGNEKDESIVVNTETLGNYIENSNMIPDFIKIDVEGAESKVIEGAIHFFSKHHPTLFIETHSETNEETIRNFFKQKNFRFFKQTENVFCKVLNIHHLTEVNPEKPIFCDGCGTLIIIHNSKINI